MSIGSKPRGTPRAKFVDRAPEAVVAEQRERLARYQGNLEALERTLGELK
ncbi:MAG: hypothetical protein JRH20_17000 [Deltaproteobacteria bacterium]|nr:hypothetical protein [Deltaproteobacteria bacterium]